jgi:hypothetical protein
MDEVYFNTLSYIAMHEGEQYANTYVIGSLRGTNKGLKMRHTHTLHTIFLACRVIGGAVETRESKKTKKQKVKSVYTGCKIVCL